LYTINYSDT